ncbi:hypothetical protein BT69DRAFT_1317728 [Atractiella rhizophila]|nr:hypothetical protein BT69DRAFT_1317728 [Atractiella rhizophila]
MPSTLRCGQRDAQFCSRNSRKYNSWVSEGTRLFLEVFGATAYVPLNRFKPWSSVFATATLSKREIHSRKLPILHVSIEDVNYVGASDLATLAALKTLGELLVIVSTHYIAYSNLTGKSELAPARELVINKLKMLNTSTRFLLGQRDVQPRLSSCNQLTRLATTAPVRVFFQLRRAKCAKTAFFES